MDATSFGKFIPVPGINWSFVSCFMCIPMSEVENESFHRLSIECNDFSQSLGPAQCRQSEHLRSLQYQQKPKNPSQQTPGICSHCKVSHLCQKGSDGTDSKVPSGECHGPPAAVPQPYWLPLSKLSHDTWRHRFFSSVFKIEISIEKEKEHI